MQGLHSLPHPSRCRLSVCSSARAQPRAVRGAWSSLRDAAAQSPSPWWGTSTDGRRTRTPMSRDADGAWTVRRQLRPGRFQYMFLVDGTRYMHGSGEPRDRDNYNGLGRNSVFVLTEEGEVLLTAHPPAPSRIRATSIRRVPGRKPVYLNIIWHQHQPLYVDPATDSCRALGAHARDQGLLRHGRDAPASIPDIHCTINLTSSLLHQLRDYYVDRLGPFVDIRQEPCGRRGILEEVEGEDRSLDRPRAEARPSSSTEADRATSTGTPGTPSASAR